VERRLKERLIGASVLVLAAVIFIPMLLDDTTQYNSEIKKSNIPKKPEGEFSTRIIPIEEFQPASEAVTQTVPIPVPVTVTEGSVPPAETGARGSVPEEPGPGDPETAGSSSTTDLPVAASSIQGKDVGVRAWIVQLGSFSSEENAQKLNDSLRKQGFSAFVEPLQQKSGIIYRVRVGPELLRSDAEDIRVKIKKSMQMDGLVIPYP